MTSTDLDPRNERRRPPGRVAARVWIRRNLFNSTFNSVLTVVLLLTAAAIVVQTARWLFITSEWEAVQRNLTLFMQGTFDRDEQWRLVAAVLLTATAAGLAAGNLSRARQDVAEETDEPLERSRIRDVVRRFWPVELLVLVMLLASRTVRPWLFAGAAIALLLAAYGIGRLRPRRLNGVAWGVVALLALASFQVMSGTGGSAWFYAGLILAVTVWPFTQPLLEGSALGSAARSAVAVSMFVAAWAIYQLPLFDFGGIGWSEWSGLQLTLVATVIVIIAAFPIGVLMALGRRSTFPAFRWLTVTYIEFVRGVPLITLLLTAQFFIGFFLNTDDPLDDVTRALVAMILFTGAYIAEIIRGGLQAVPKGQIEAGQAMGLSAFKIMRLIVLPQALRAVIPAMVGQFISLFKDTSLLTIIGITELLGVRLLVHAQPSFRTNSFEVTLVFIAFVYWAIAFTMSRESQRLEKRLGVGVR